jgi:hypothetical protein
LWLLAGAEVGGLNLAQVVMEREEEVLVDI